MYQDHILSSVPPARVVFGHVVSRDLVTWAHVDVAVYTDEWYDHNSIYTGSATIVDGVTAAMNIYRDESFGPIVGIIRAKDEADAIRLANDSEYGLSAAVFTRDTARGLRVARQIRSGICHVNGPTVHDEAQMPFGGVGASGYGRFGGKAGIDSFTELRWVTIETQPGHYPI